jgi:hypothetical protein
VPLAQVWAWRDACPGPPEPARARGQLVRPHPGIPRNLPLPGRAAGAPTSREIEFACQCSVGRRERYGEIHTGADMCGRGHTWATCGRGREGAGEREVREGEIYLEGGPAERGVSERERASERASGFFMMREREALRW